MYNRGDDMQLNTKTFLAVCMTCLMVMALSGCGDKKTSTPESAEITDPEALGPMESLETDISESEGIMEGRTSGPMLPVYFDFDSSIIATDQIGRLESNADFIKSNKDITVRIEGNCDSRGTSEYNLALGERRALSAKKYLVNLGVEPVRLSTISWGEEKLLLFGHDELSWAQNRRDDFVIIKK